MIYFNLDTSPDLFVYENDTIEIECVLPDNVEGGRTSSDLVFNETCNNSPWVSYDKTSQYLKVRFFLSIIWRIMLV